MIHSPSEAASIPPCSRFRVVRQERGSIKNVRRTLSITQKVKDLFAGRRYEAMSLAELVTLLADDPKPTVQDAFYRRLVGSKVGTRVPNSDGSLARGDRVMTQDEKIGIPTITRPDGIRYLVVYCDIPSMFRAFPKETFVELDARVVLQMAKSIGGGVIVQNGLDGRQSWAGVPREHVEVLLSPNTAPRAGES